MGRKRRGSQAFHFEQNEETLLQNENIVKLYQNKTFQPPEPKPYETIFEEGIDPPTKARTKRGQAESRKDGSLVLGLNKFSRKISEYKYWKQDDKDRNRKRKLMIQRLWKGRKKGKLIPLDCAGEQKLLDLIADRESSDEEEESSSSNRRRLLSSEKPLPKNCVWSSLEPASSKTQFAKDSTSSCEMDFGSQCVWTNAGLDDYDHIDDESTNQTCESLSCDIERRPSESLNVPDDMSSRRESDSNDLQELAGIIPESELAELLNTKDLLFCNDVKPKPNVAKGVLGSIENVLISQGSNTKETRKSLRKSARIMSIPNITGSIYIGSKSSEDFDIDVDNGPLVEDALNIGRKENRKRIPDVSSEGPPPRTVPDPEVFDDVFLHVPGNDDETSRKKRRSYSLEDGLGRYSLDGSRKNSLLTVTGDMEINISMPSSVRRSFPRISFPKSSRWTPPVPPGDMTEKEEEVKEPVKFRLPVPTFLDTDSEDEEVIISGNMRSKHFKKVKSRAKKKVN